MGVGIIKGDNKNAFKCITVWLLCSFSTGYLLSFWLDASFMQAISFVDEPLLKDKNKYYSVLICILLSSPFAFRYMYKYCFLDARFSGGSYYLLWLVLFLGLIWNSGVFKFNMEKSQENYKSSILFRWMIQEFDWIGAATVSFLGAYMVIIAASLLLIHHQNKKN